MLWRWKDQILWVPTNVAIHVLTKHRLSLANFKSRGTDHMIHSIDIFWIVNGIKSIKSKHEPATRIVQKTKSGIFLLRESYYTRYKPLEYLEWIPIHKESEHYRSISYELALNSWNCRYRELETVWRIGWLSFTRFTIRTWTGIPRDGLIGSLD